MRFLPNSMSLLEVTFNLVFKMPGQAIEHDFSLRIRDKNRTIWEESHYSGRAALPWRSRAIRKWSYHLDARDTKRTLAIRNSSVICKKPSYSGAVATTLDAYTIWVLAPLDSAPPSDAQTKCPRKKTDRKHKPPTRFLLRYLYEPVFISPSSQEHQRNGARRSLRCRACRARRPNRGDP